MVFGLGECSNGTCSKSPEEELLELLESEEALERVVWHGFKMWHLIFLSITGVMCLIILFCCCVKFRIPRTKQEIEADYIRRKILRKFRKRLKAIQNQDLDEMDLKKALDKIREEFKSDTESLAHSEAGFSGATNSSIGPGGQGTYRRASQIHIDISLEELRAHSSGLRARLALAISRFFCRSKTKEGDKVALTVDAEGETQLTVPEGAFKTKKDEAKDKDKEKDKKEKEKEKAKKGETSKKEATKTKPKEKDVEKGEPSEKDKKQALKPPPASSKKEKGKEKANKDGKKDMEVKGIEMKAGPSKAPSSEAPADKNQKQKEKDDKEKKKAEKEKEKLDKERAKAEKTKVKIENEKAQKSDKEKAKADKEKAKADKEKAKADKEKAKAEANKKAEIEAKKKAEKEKKK